MVVIADAATESDGRADHAIDERDYRSHIHSARGCDGSKRHLQNVVETFVLYVRISENIQSKSRVEYMGDIDPNDVLFGH